MLGAFATTHLLTGLLCGVGVMDARAVVGAALVLIGVAIVAVGLPARRAAAIDPALPRY